MNKTKNLGPGKHGSFFRALYELYNNLGSFRLDKAKNAQLKFRLELLNEIAQNQTKDITADSVMSEDFELLVAIMLSADLLDISPDKVQVVARLAQINCDPGSQESFAKMMIPETTWEINFGRFVDLDAFMAKLLKERKEEFAYIKAKQEKEKPSQPKTPNLIKDFGWLQKAANLPLATKTCEQKTQVLESTGRNSRNKPFVSVRDRVSTLFQKGTNFSICESSDFTGSCLPRETKRIRCKISKEALVKLVEDMAKFSPKKPIIRLNEENNFVEVIFNKKSKQKKQPKRVA